MLLIVLYTYTKHRRSKWGTSPKAPCQITRDRSSWTYTCTDVFSYCWNSSYYHPNGNATTSKLPSPAITVELQLCEMQRETARKLLSLSDQVYVYPRDACMAPGRASGLERGVEINILTRWRIDYMAVRGLLPAEASLRFYVMRGAQFRKVVTFQQKQPAALGRVSRDAWVLREELDPKWSVKKVCFTVPNGPVYDDLSSLFQLRTICSIANKTVLQFKQMSYRQSSKETLTTTEFMN